MRYIQGVTKKRNSCNFPSLQPCLGHAASFHCKFFWAHFNFDSFFSQKCFTLSIDLEKGKAPVLKYIHTPQYIYRYVFSLGEKHCTPPNYWVIGP